MAASIHCEYRVAAPVFISCQQSALVSSADEQVDEQGQTDSDAHSVSGLLTFTKFRFLGHVNPGGPYEDNTRVWGDVYGYAYDGVDPMFTGKSFAYVGVDVNGSGMAIFDITDFTDPVLVGAYGSARFRDVEVHDGIGYFSGSSATHIVDLRTHPVNPHLLQHVLGSHALIADTPATGRVRHRPRGATRL